MAAYKNLLQIIEEIIHGTRTVGKAGRIPTLTSRELQALNTEHAYPELMLFPHGVVSRFTNPNDGWSEQRIADSIEELLRSEKTVGMPNFWGGNRVATEAMVAPGSPFSIFAPVTPTREGKTGLVTLYETSPEKILNELEALKRHQGGGQVPIPGQPSLAPQIGGDAVSQLDRFSAVDNASTLDELIRRFKGGVKAVAPIAATGGLLGVVNTLHSWDGRDKLHPSLNHPRYFSRPSSSQLSRIPVARNPLGRRFARSKFLLPG